MHKSTPWLSLFLILFPLFCFSQKPVLKFYCEKWYEIEYTAPKYSASRVIKNTKEVDDKINIDYTKEPESILIYSSSKDTISFFNLIDLEFEEDNPTFFYKGKNRKGEVWEIEWTYNPDTQIVTLEMILDKKMIRIPMIEK
ncbi:MAG: hypothetical protein KDC84_06360 [Crocinitomicaceae bacterium]|nr:hypothetical protein [Crocinitomicaceae bacterium]